MKRFWLALIGLILCAGCVGVRTPIEYQERGDVKISQLPSATAPTGSELVPVVQASETRKATIQQIIDTAGSATYEPALGNPGADGWCVKSTMAGVRSWGLCSGSMVYPGAGIPLSTGSAWGTSITDNSANWNTAYGWGNHASGGYLTSESDPLALLTAGTDNVKDTHIDWGSGAGQVNALDVPFTPSGNIAATDVKAALEELDIEHYLKTEINTQSLLEAIWGVTLATDAELAAATFATSAITSGTFDIARLPALTQGYIWQGDGSNRPAAVNSLVWSTLTLPNGTSAPGTCTVADVFFDTNEVAGLNLYGCTATNVQTRLSVNYFQKCAVIKGATASDDYPLEKFPYAITITAIHVYVIGGTNVIGGLDECTGTNGVCSSVTAVDADITGTAGNDVADDGALTNPGITANNWIQWHTTSVSGTNTSVSVCFNYTVD